MEEKTEKQQTINKTNGWFFEQINQMDKSFSKGLQVSSQKSYGDILYYLNF